MLMRLSKNPLKELNSVWSSYKNIWFAVYFDTHKTAEWHILLGYIYYYLSYRSQVFLIKFSRILEGLETPLENSLMAKLLVILEWATPTYSKFKVVLNSELSYHVGIVSRLFSTFFQENPCFFQIVYSVYFQHSLHK